MGASVWDKEGMVEELKKLHAEGLSASQIADRLGMLFGVRTTRNAVIGKVTRLGLARPSTETCRLNTRRYHRRKAKAERRAAPQPQKISPLRRALEMAPEPMPFAIVEEVVVPEKERVGVEGLGQHQCRWPIGDPQSDDFHFCHHKRIGGISYCEIHARRAYRPIEQQPREIRRSFANDNPTAPVRETEKV